jgi:hypothetical protein
MSAIFRQKESTVLVVGRHRAVVVAGDAVDAKALEQRGCLVWPRRVADQIAQVVGGVDPRTSGDVVEHGLQRGQIGADVGNQCNTHRVFSWYGFGRVGSPLIGHGEADRAGQHDAVTRSIRL